VNAGFERGNRIGLGLTGRRRENMANILKKVALNALLISKNTDKKGVTLRLHYESIISYGESWEI
jgi:hypothetical protein